MGGESQKGTAVDEGERPAVQGKAQVGKDH